MIRLAKALFEIAVWTIGLSGVGAAFLAVASFIIWDNAFMLPGGMILIRLLIILGAAFGLFRVVCMVRDKKI